MKHIQWMKMGRQHEISRTNTKCSVSNYSSPLTLFNTGAFYFQVRGTNLSLVF